MGSPSPSACRRPSVRPSKHRRAPRSPHDARENENGLAKSSASSISNNLRTRRGGYALCAHVVVRPALHRIALSTHCGSDRQLSAEVQQRPVTISRYGTGVPGETCRPPRERDAALAYVAEPSQGPKMMADTVRWRWQSPRASLFFFRQSTIGLFGFELIGNYYWCYRPV